MSNTTSPRGENTNSEVLLGALPALLRAESSNRVTKDVLIAILGYWCTPTEKRPSGVALTYPRPAEIQSLLDAGIKASQTEDERDCILCIMERGALRFAPADYLRGCM